MHSRHAEMSSLDVLLRHVHKVKALPPRQHCFMGSRQAKPVHPGTDEQLVKHLQHKPITTFILQA